jgi:hypothetical protein
LVLVFFQVLFRNYAPVRYQVSVPLDIKEPEKPLLPIIVDVCPMAESTIVSEPTLLKVIVFIAELAPESLKGICTFPTDAAGRLIEIALLVVSNKRKPSVTKIALGLAVVMILWLECLIKAFASDFLDSYDPPLSFEINTKSDPEMTSKSVRSEVFRSAIKKSHIKKQQLLILKLNKNYLLI